MNRICLPRKTIEDSFVFRISIIFYMINILCINLSLINKMPKNKTLAEKPKTWTYNYGAGNLINPLEAHSYWNELC